MPAGAPPGTPSPKYMVLLEPAGTRIVVLTAIEESLFANENEVPEAFDHVVLLTPNCVVPIQLPPYTSMYALVLPVLLLVMAFVVAMLLPALSLPKFIADGLSEIVHVFVVDEKVMAVVLPATR